LSVAQLAHISRTDNVDRATLLITSTAPLWYRRAAHLLDGLLDRRGRKRLAGMENPHTAFFSQLRRAAQGPQSDPIVQAFQLQFVAGRKLQLFPHRLWEHYATQLIYRELGSHSNHIGSHSNHNRLGFGKIPSSPGSLYIVAWLSRALAHARSYTSFPMTHC
jgi:hypothetical protein